MALNSGWSFAPLSPWQYVVTAAAILLFLSILARGFFDRWQSLGSSPIWRFAIGLFSLLAIIFFTLAAWNPVKAREPEPGEVHLAVVVDGSDSVLRADGGWENIKAVGSSFLQKSLAQVPEDYKTSGAATLFTFRGNVQAIDSSLPQLSTDFSALDSADLASGQGSDIGAALKRAAEAGEKSGKRSAILLVSDGHDTVGDALAAAEEIAGLGMPISVLPIESGEPELAISSANLSSRLRAGEETNLRGVIYNHTNAAVQAALSVAENPALETADSDEDSPFSGTVDVPLPELASGQYARLRQQVAFEGLGLQYLDLELRNENGDATHRRRFFAHVERPVELLALGGDFSWVGALAPDVIKVTSMRAADFSTETDLAPYDGLVISGVPYDVFDEAALDKVKSAVTEDGLGLMLINGDHAGAAEETPTVLRSYHETDFDEILPLSTDPRPPNEDPPVRNVVIMLDTSGSMNGWPLAKAVEIINHIINEHLTRSDYLDFIILGGIPYIEEQQMHEAGKEKVLGQMAGGFPSGASELQRALELLNNRKLSNCGLIILSDGIVSGSGNTRPDCVTTIFAINPGITPDSALYELAFPIVVGPEMDPSAIDIPSVEAEDRDKFFEAGTYTPLSIEDVIGQSQPLTIPKLELDGAAISYPRKEAEVFSFRPKFADPLLAYGPASKGYVGIFTTGFTDSWIASDEGRQAIQEWLLRIVPYAARGRYHFDLRDDGRFIHLTLALQNEDRPPPMVEAVTVAVEIGDTIYDVPMQADPQAPSTFNGIIKDVPRQDNAQMATMIIDENGTEALARAQRIPLVLPPVEAISGPETTEALSYGVNEGLLRELTEISGGQYDPPDGASFFQQRPPAQEILVIWPWLAAAGAIFYFLAIMLHRLDR